MVDARVIRAQEKYDEVHKELIEAGIKLLSIKPISSLSLNSLAEYTEVSKTSIYNHFNSSPEHFYYDILVYCRNYMLEIFNDTSPEDPKQKIIYYQPGLPPGEYYKFAGHQLKVGVGGTALRNMMLVTNG